MARRNELEMYEHRTKPLLPRRQFFARLARSAWFGLLIIGGSLGLGMIGYHVLEKMPWLDAFANASMILSGMGPLAELKTSAGKLFAGCYALFSGVAFLTSVGVLFAPVVHRFLHKFHVENTNPEDKKRE
jgi:hypothetical protein